MQLKLLDVQELDSRHDALEQQIARPPEAAEIAELTASRQALEGRAGELSVQVADLTREQRKADDDVEQVKARRVRDQQRLDTGMVSNPKDLERLQHELISLDRRISDLEDAELDVMERLETAQKEQDGLGSRIAEIDERLALLTQARDRRVAELREAAATVARERAGAVSGMPADLLSLYDRLREQKDGVGAAALRARRCGGCRLELNSGDLAAIAKRPSDEVVRCEECNRILVRTGESGL